MNLLTPWRELFVDSIPDNLEFNAGGHFVASRELLQSRSRQFYLKILNLLAS